MDEQWLGDSYDLVKRFWKKSLEPVAPLYADPRFVPSTIRSRYTAVTTIPILDTRPHGRVGVLIDPDTGIPLPDSTPTRATMKYASLQFIIELNKEFHPEYIICFDQSFHRKHELTKEDRRAKKMTFLTGSRNTLVLLCISCAFSLCGADYTYARIRS